MLVKKKIQFDPQGQNLSYSIDLGGIGTFDYYVTLYESDDLHKVNNFPNQDYNNTQATPNSIQLPSPANSNNGRYLALDSTFTALQSGNFHIYLRVFQGTNEITDPNTPDQPILANIGDADVNISIQLIAIH